MVKLLLLGLLLFVSQEPTYIKGKKFSGYIFNAMHQVLIMDEDKRYTPTEADIILTEKLIVEKIKELNKRQENQSHGCPVIHKSLRRYVRQYVGFINAKGEKVVWINFIWKDRVSDEELKEDIVVVNDGCSYFWTIKVNLFTLTLHDLQISGQG